MKALFSKIRAWKNRTFKDWLWDLLIGAFCGVIGLLGLFFHINWLVVVVPFGFTLYNQLVINRVFEIKDAVLRMVVPGVMYLVIIAIKAG